MSVRALRRSVLLGLLALTASGPVLFPPEPQPLLVRAQREARLGSKSPIVTAPFPPREPEPQVLVDITPAWGQAAPALVLYRNGATRDAVVEFFVRETGSEQVAIPLLYHAEQNDVPVLLAFALAWKESRYNPRAVNANARSVDRGLLQLNDQSFPHLAEEDFFHSETNASYGMEYLSYAIARGGTVSEALLIYNAGISRFLRGHVPQSTAVYIREVTWYMEQLERRFVVWMSEQFPNSGAPVFVEKDNDNGLRRVVVEPVEVDYRIARRPTEDPTRRYVP